MVYLRLPTHVAWSIARKKNRLLRVVLDGLATGLVLALILQLIPGGGEPSVTPALANRLIWFAVVGEAGAAQPSAPLRRQFLSQYKVHLNQTGQPLIFAVLPPNQAPTPTQSPHKITNAPRLPLNPVISISPSVAAW